VTDQPFSRFPVPRLDEVPEDLRTRILEVQERTGFVPNVFLALAHRPDELRAFIAYHDALMERDSGLTRAEREMVVVVTSARNQCLYCVVSHGAVLRIRAKDPLLADKVAVDHRAADLPPRQVAILDFALQVAGAAHTVSDDDVAALQAHGLSLDDVWDVGAIAAFFAMSNRLAGLGAMRPNDEFYALGR